jgi:Rab-GTPase-TBC domain
LTSISTEDDNCSDASAPTLVNSNITGGKSETVSRGRSSSLRRRVLSRNSSQSSLDKDRVEGRSDVSIPFDEMMSRSIDLHNTLVKTCEITSKSSDSRLAKLVKKKAPASTTNTVKTRGITKSYSMSRLPGVSSLKSFPSEDTAEEPKKDVNASRLSSLTLSKSLSSLKGRSRSLPRGDGNTTETKNHQTSEKKPLSHRGRSFSRGRKSRLVNQMVKKQNAILQDRKKEDPPEQEAPRSTTNVSETEVSSEKVDSPAVIEGIRSLDSRDLAIGSIDDTDDVNFEQRLTIETMQSNASVEGKIDIPEITLPVVDMDGDSGVVLTAGDDKMTEVESEPMPEKNIIQEAELVHDNLLKHNEHYGEYEDPPLEELESVVSVGFDMRSIHDSLSSDVLDANKSMAEGTSGLWGPSNIVFEETEDEKKEDMQLPSESIIADSVFTPSVSEEKKENTEIAPQTQDSSWDASTVPFAESGNRSLNRGVVDDVDMFDTSSWAGATEARFSDVSFSNLAANVESEKQFVLFMMEEMKVRSLTDDESRMLFEAQQNLQKAEDAVLTESKKVSKEDEPLIADGSNDELEADVGDTVPLEDRLKSYENCEADDESVSNDSERGNECGVEEDFEDNADAQVEYVSQEDDVPEGDFTSDATAVDMNDFEEVPARDAPTFDLASGIATKTAGEELKDITAVEEAPMSVLISTPPPPPPGVPKKKKRSKSKSGSKKKVPLLAPPPEEKVRKWEETKMKAQKYVAAMKDELEKADAQALNSTAAYFQPFPDEVSDAKFDSIARAGIIEVCGPIETNQKENEDSPEIHMFLSGLSDDDAHENNFDEKSGSCGMEECATGKALHSHLSSAAELEHGNGADPFFYLKESSENLDEYDDGAKDEAQLREEKQPSFFRPPEKTPGDLNLEKVFHHSNQTDNVLADEQLAQKVALATSAAATSFEETFSVQKAIPSISSTSFELRESKLQLKGSEIMFWFCKSVLKSTAPFPPGEDSSTMARSILQENKKYNLLCRYIADNVNEVTSMLRPEIGRSESVLSSFDESTVVSIENTMGSFDEQSDIMLDAKRPWLRPPILSETSVNLSPLVIAANSVSFFALAAKLSKISSPFGNSNPFLTKIVESSLQHDRNDNTQTPQEFLFKELDGGADELIEFAYQVKCSCDAEMNKLGEVGERDGSLVSTDEGQSSLKRYAAPDFHPSPFESSVVDAPRIVAVVLSFLGDPVAVCRMKMVNRFCRRLVLENEHILMQNAVRTGGIEMSVRPAFWMYVTLQKCNNDNSDDMLVGKDELSNKAKEGEEGKWHNVIERDVARSFGNMPPHKTGAKLRNDSIIRALVTYGQNRTMKRGVRGGGEPFPTPEIGPRDTRKARSRPTSPNSSSPPWEVNGEEDSAVSGASETPTDTVSDWGGVSPKGSFAGSVNDPEYESTAEGHLSRSGTDMSVEELALSGNSLTQDAKVDLRNKLSFVLHCLAATHEEIGYCQGMDYVVAHLLRILQETVKWKTATNSLADVITTARSVHVPSEPVSPENLMSIYKEIDENLVVEEVILRIMDTLFMHYNLRHMYWPELRCLKTCCRVFERLIQIKLPVLADHFEHHELNVGLFALGWFQTLFLYLPSMPSATVCHIWDIWLVERSFKIFFRVGTAILFLSQPTLLNHELEGMMTYLNTIPDATLLRPDILIPCALNIKVTNRMLQELEAEVMQQPN